ncbi:hypothetical protein [Flavobacterium tructae]|uniref:hypothetical protein n=1 Tax=Flavobacterium tructae TaxID=1114873 RepID=UPI0035A99385
MIKTKTRYLSFIYWIAIIGTDIFAYIILGVLQMDYEDNYTTSKGEYWSLASMTQQQLFFYISLQLWNILNIIGIIFIV